MSGVVPDSVARGEIGMAVLTPDGRAIDGRAFVGRIYAYAARGARLAFEAAMLPDGRVRLTVARPDGVAREDFQEVASATQEAAIIWRRLIEEVLGQPAATRGTAA